MIAQGRSTGLPFSYSEARNLLARKAAGIQSGNGVGIVCIVFVVPIVDLVRSWTVDGI